jgi:hypothetical protein
MSIIYALVGTGNRALRHSNSNNQIVIGDFNSYSLAKFAVFQSFRTAKLWNINNFVMLFQAAMKFLPRLVR